MSLAWSQANPFGIWFGDTWPPHTESSPDPWNAGHMNDVLMQASGALIAAADSGGVWLIPGDGSLPTCVSDDWEHSRFESLAFGPDSEETHVYAGGEALYVTTLSAALP